MKHEVWICGYPSTYGGANTEMAHVVDLLRQHEVDVHLVPLTVISDVSRAWADSIGCHTHHFDDYAMFKDKILLAFNNGKLLTRLPFIVREGRPRCFVWWNCMTDCYKVELMCHLAGWIDYHAFGSEYQRSQLMPKLLGVNGDTKTFDGYQQYFNPNNDLQRIRFNYSAPTKFFTIGRISRDDPRKFSPDTWDIFDAIDTGDKRKRALVLGFGEYTRRCRGNPPLTLDAKLIEPDKLPVNSFYSSVHCIIHQTGGSGESFCRIVPEAYAAGVPIIVEKKFAFPEIVIDGETGFMCEDGKEMIERANQLARDEELRKRIIFNAREHLQATIGNAERAWKPWEAFLSKI
jgi:glycosyltransferase involved in cell wall biosynthesis